jgi:hypothetical protein
MEAVNVNFLKTLTTFASKFLLQNPKFHVMWVPVISAWRVGGLRIEETASRY